MTNDAQIPSTGSVGASKTTRQIEVEGDIRIRMCVLALIGLLLVIGGIWGLAVNEAAFGKYWQGLQAIISGAIFGLVGFIAGRSSVERKD